MTSFADSLTEFFFQTIRLTRDQVWMGDQVYKPTVRREFAEYPRTGYVGADYSPGGLVLVGANGNSTEGQDADKVIQCYEQRDQKHMELMERFRRTGSADSLAALNAFEAQDILDWHMDWLIQGTLDRLGLKLDDVVVCNVIPFSTKDAPPHKSNVWKNAIDLYFAEFVRRLAPGGIVWMGHAAHRRSALHLMRRPARIEAVVSRQRNLPLQERFAQLDSVLERLP